MKTRFSHWARVAAVVSLWAVITACTSSTLINSQPQGARLFLNGEPVGTTPFTMSDTRIVGSTTSVRLEYPGYDTVNGVISRNEEFDVGACIGGVFLLVPFLWIMGYKPVHTFELRPSGGMPGMAPGVPASAWGAPPPPAYPPPAAAPPPAGYPPPAGAPPPAGYPPPAGAPPPAGYPPAPAPAPPR
jgi:hypothetical protein